MKKKRKDTDEIQPDAEDMGIFKGSVVTVAMEITPLRRVTERGDLLCSGFMGDKRIEIVFPGRRRHEARALEMALDDYARAINRDASRKGIPAPHAIDIRFPLEVEGRWRVRLDDAEDLEIERVYQFMAGRWTYTDSTNQTKSGGESPKTRPITRMPVI